MAAKGGEGRNRPSARASEQNGASRDQAQVQLLTDLDFLKGLIDAIDASGIDTLEINRGGTRIRISKSPTQVVGAPAAAPSVVMTTPAAPTGGAPAASTPAPIAGDAPATAPARSNLTDVTSPMVGTFYRAPAPEAPSYVEVGSTVHKGQTLCILEAMKLMNELEAEVDGVVREILVDNADPVEYGQVLFRIEPA